MHSILFASCFFAFLSLVASKPYDYSLQAGINSRATADCSSCKCGDSPSCAAGCDKCSVVPGGCTLSNGDPCAAGQTSCDYCNYPGCKDNCLCWFYCSSSHEECVLKGGNCVSDRLIFNSDFDSKADMMASTHRIPSVVDIAKKTVYVKMLLATLKNCVKILLTFLTYRSGRNTTAR